MSTLVPYDDRDGSIWMDGKLIPWRQAKIHVLSHALHYASSVFEGERAYGGVIFKAKEHHERLLNSARLVGMEPPWSRDDIDQAAEQVLAVNQLKEAYLRPLIWRGSGQMGVSATQAGLHLMIAAWSWARYYASKENGEGIRLTIARWRRPPPESAPVHAKTAGLYMICTLAKHEAEAEGFHDALMLDTRGRVAEATSANIFLVQDGRLHTPRPDCFLNGITRQTIIALAREQGIEVVERAIFPEELATTKEVFLTGTAAEVTPVTAIDDCHFPPGGKITGRLQKAYSAACGKQAVRTAA